MSHGPRRIINFCLALVFAVMSVNLSGVLNLQTAHAANKGTIKVGNIDLADGDDADDSTANQPHIDGCSLEVRFFGYDEGEHSGTVTFEGQAPTKNQLASVSGNTNVSFTSTSNQGSVENHVESYTLAFTGEPQAQQGYHVKVTVQMKSEGKKSKVFWVQGCTTPLPPTHVTAVKPVVNPADKCGIEDNTYSIAPVTGVVYKVNDQVVSGDNISAGSTQSVTVKAYPVDSTYTLDGTTEWTLEFNTSACPPVVQPTEPIWNDVCLGEGLDTFTIPSVAGVTYYIKSAFGSRYTPISAGSHVALGTVTIKAVTENGTVYGPWSHTFTTKLCDVTIKTPPAIDDQCGTTNDTYTIPTTEHVTYKIATTKWVYVMGFPIFSYTSYDTITAGTHIGNATIKAVADLGYTIKGQDTWTFNFTDTPCDTIVETVKNPEFIDECGLENDIVRIPESTGVIYILNGVDITEPGDYHVNGSATVTSKAAPGYSFGGTIYTWSENYLTDNSCTPGMGGAGEGDPADPTTPVVVANTVKKLTTVTELPQTGPSDGNAFVKIFSILISGATTYGALFFALNRRNLLGNK